MAPSGATRQGLRADATRNQARVLRVARDLLAGGDPTLPMNTIARIAGVGVGTVYRHFPSRAALLESLARDSLERLLAEATAAAQDEDPGRGLERLVRTAVTCLREDPALPLVLQTTASTYGETRDLRQQLDAVLTTLLVAAGAAGAVRSDLDAHDLRRLLLGVAAAAHAGEQRDDTVDRYVDVLLSGLRPSVGTPGGT